MSTIAAFPYPPLHGGQYTKVIRLLTLLPGESDDDVVCTLEAVPLEHQPVYEALSYYWGPPDESSRVTCNGVAMSGTPNLLSALRHYRDPDTPRTLWVDAICINQSDDAEKSQQVPLMRLIFSTAVTVLAWLGPGTEDTGHAHSLLLDLARVHGEQASKNDSRTYHELGVDGWEEYDLPDMLHSAYTALAQLLDRPYFNRVWIVQELAVAQQVRVRFGAYEMAWEVFVKAALHAYKLHVPGHLDSARRFDRIQAVENARLAVQSGSSRPLLDLLLLYRGLDATLPEDKVFALCGLATDAGPDGLGIRTDYLAGMSAVYQGVASRMLMSPGNLDILSVPRAKSSAQMPSWVPDWSLPATVLSLRDCDLDGEPLLNFAAASADADPAVQVLASQGHIVLSGYAIDHVAEVGRQYENNSDKIMSVLAGLRQGWNSVAALGSWQEMIQPDPGKVYPHTGETLSDAFCQTLIAGNTLGDLDATKDEFDCWYSLSAEMQRLALRPIFSVLSLRMFTGFVRYIRQIASMVGGDERVEKLMRFRYKMVFANNRRLFKTRLGYIGLGPDGMVAGDEIALVRRCMVPLVLRIGAHGRRELVGDAYVHGVMHGEAFAGERCQEIRVS